MINGNDFRAAAGLGRYPVDLTEDPPRGRGLFAVARENGETAITNIRRLAGRERAPGSRLVLAAAVLLGLLAAGLFVVTLNAQYKYVFAAKGQQVPAVIEAASLDLGMVIFTLLALGLAMAEKPARIERALIVACAVGSAGQNYAAADVSSPRSVAAYVVPSLFLALVVDRVVAVVRRHALGEAERSVWSTVGRSSAVVAKGLGLVLLYGLRFVLAPPSTGAGLRRMVLNAAPVPGMIVLEAQQGPRCGLLTDDGPCPGPWPCTATHVVPAAEAIDPPVTEPAELAGASKKARLGWWYERDADHGNRGAVAAAARRLAPKVDLSEGTARAYLGQICDDLEGMAS